MQRSRINGCLCLEFEKMAGKLVISLNLVLAGLRLGLKNRQVGEKWVSDDCSYLCKGLNISHANSNRNKPIKQAVCDRGYVGAKVVLGANIILPKKALRFCALMP
jgi:hypothetical protein